MNKIISLEKFNFHIYVISAYTKGPVKIGFSHHPPSRLKEIQTGNPDKLRLCGSLSFNKKIEVELIEKIIHSHLKDNNLYIRGEWFNLSVQTALTILKTFPLCRENLFKEVKIKKGKIENTIDLIQYGLQKKIINDDEYDFLNEVFLSFDENKYQFNDFTINS
jgi:hypothetical protein